MDRTTVVTGVHTKSFPGADPQELGGYKVLGRLGAGGMGVVYLAQKPLEPRVALKVMRAEFAHQPEFRARFAREVSAARAVTGDFTAQVVDANLTGAVPWIATEYVPGPTLAQQIEQAGPLTQEQTRLLGLGLADALRSIHAAGMVHRDLKPGNILLAARGPKVIDFGIAHAAEATSLTQTGALMGSLAWMSPEQVTGQQVSPACDVFALGLVLAYAASGRHPYGEGYPQALSHRLTTQQPDLTGVPEALRQPIAAMLALDPDQRPTVPDITAALESTRDRWGDPTWIVHQGWNLTRVAAPQPVAPVPAPAPVGRQGGRGRGALVVLASAATAAAVALGVVTIGQNSLGTAEAQESASNGQAPEEQSGSPNAIEPAEVSEDAPNDDDAWPETFRESISLSNGTGEVPEFPTSLRQWRPDGPVETTGNRLFTSAGDYVLQSEIPATMNGCNNQMFTVRWRALNSQAVVRATWGPSWNAPDGEKRLIDPYVEVAEGSSGWMMGDGCSQPAFEMIGLEGYTGSGSPLTDIVVEYQTWRPAV